MISNFKIIVLLLIIIISVIFLYYFFTRETFRSKKTYSEELEEEMEQFVNSNVRYINKLLVEENVDISHNLNHI